MEKLNKHITKVMWTLALGRVLEGKNELNDIPKGNKKYHLIKELNIL